MHHVLRYQETSYILARMISRRGRIAKLPVVKQTEHSCIKAETLALEFLRRQSVKELLR